MQYLGDFSIHYFEGDLKWLLPLELLRITFYHCLLDDEIIGSVGQP